MIAFKNNAERKKFLNDCESWELYHDAPCLKLKVYIAHLSTGASILAYVYDSFYGKSGSKAYKLFYQNEKIIFSQYFDNINRIVEYIRTMKLSVLEGGAE